MLLQSDRSANASTIPSTRYSEHSVATQAAPHHARPGLYSNEPDTCRRSIREFIRVFAHLAFLCAVFVVYKLEGRALGIVALTSLAALPIHYALPLRWKQPFFVVASIMALGLVFGWPVMAWSVGITVTLVLVASLPVNWWIRVGVITAAGVGLGLARAGFVKLSIPALTWPIVGSICMFRLAVYLYEMKHAKQRERAGDVISYFFLLPNFAFPLFPVVDYRTMRRGYFASDIHETQRIGLSYMLRGVTHLLLYRWIYHDVLPTPDEIHGVATLILFIVSNYLCYLHVSGQFHLACGLMHLFGYKLPETHHHYFLATGFTDYWRRINIYWKDFMVKLVFNPVAFRLKRLPQITAMTIATVCVFVVTWLAHAYQAFWLRGNWGFTVPDALFWGILGLLVVINLRNDARAPRGRRAAPASFFSRATLVRAAKVVGTFATIAVLWSLWSSPTLESWFDLLRHGFS